MAINRMCFQRAVERVSDYSGQEDALSNWIFPGRKLSVIEEPVIPLNMILLQEWKGGRLLAKEMNAYSNHGAYASHGHAIAANGLTAWRLQYACPNTRGEAYTIYTNTPVAGAMRAYGIPQAAFAIECFMDDIAMRSIWIPWNFAEEI